MQQLAPRRKRRTMPRYCAAWWPASHPNTMTSAKDDDCAECNAKAQPARIELTPAPPTAEALSQHMKDKLEAFVRDCEDLDDPMSCHEVAEYYRHVDKNPAAAAEVYGQNCARHGYANSCAFLADMYMKGEVGKGDAPEQQRHAHALGLFRRGCLAGSGAACVQAAQLLMRQPRARADLDAARATALGYYKRACDGNDAHGCFGAGAHYLRVVQNQQNGGGNSGGGNSGGGGDDGRVAAANAGRWALRFFKKGCTLGHPTACHSAAVMFNKGAPGVPADPAQFEKYANLTRTIVQQYGASLPKQNEQ